MSDNAPSDPTDTSSPPRWAAAVPIVAMAMCALLLLMAVPPWSVFTDTMPLGPDISAHAYPIWSALERMRDGGSFVGWDPGWFDGWVAFRYYPPLGALATEGMSLVLPFAIAYKLMIALTVWLMPVTAGYFAWRIRRSRVDVAWAVIAVTAFLLTSTCYFCGGSVLSALTGEYANVLGITLALWALGAFIGVLRGESSRIVLAIAVGLTALAHPLPTVWLAVAMIITFILMVAVRPRRLKFTRALVRVWPPVLVGALLSVWWWLPFVSTREWMTAPDFPQLDLLGVFKAIPGWPVLLLLVAIGALWAIRRRDLAGLIMLSTAGFTVIVVLLITSGHLGTAGTLWDARLMPYVLLGSFWLAVLALRGIGDFAMARGNRSSEQLGRKTFLRTYPREIAIAASTLLVICYSAYVWGGLIPGITTQSTASVGSDKHGLPELNMTYTSSFGPLSWTNLGIADSVGARLLGQQKSPRWPQMQSLIDVMSAVGKEFGCARVLVDQQKTVIVDGTQYAWPFRFTGSLLPYWTQGCVKSVNGLQLDGTFLAPAIVQTDNLMSGDPETFGKWTTNLKTDLTRGATAMADLRVDYFVTREEWQAQAARKVGYPEISSKDGWVVFSVPTFPLVQAMTTEPYVITYADGSEIVNHDDWQSIASQYLNTDFETTDKFTLGGPSSWQRSDVGTIPDPVPLPKAAISDLSANGADISFSVDKIGVPVIVRRTPNANWVIDGADGPWPINPGFMVIVPTQNKVTLTLATPSSAVIGGWTSAAGVACLLALIGHDLWRDAQAVRRRRRPTETA